MDIKGMYLILLICSVLTLVCCAPKKKEESPSPAPSSLSKELQPGQNKSAMPEQCKDLTPKQCEEIEINKEWRYKPFPG